MKFMKLLSVLLLTISFTQCASSKFDKNPPFTIEKAIVNHWVGGVEGASGTNVLIYLNKMPNVTFQNIYFNNKIEKIQHKKTAQGTPILVGYFTKNSKIASNDMILDADHKKEFGNQLPQAVQKFPFELKENEAVISYKKDEKTLYYKVKNIQQEQQQFYK